MSKGLIKRYKQDTSGVDGKLRDQLIMDYAPLIRYVAQRISSRLPSNIEIDDLISAGVIGLMDAIEKYVPVHGAKFETYAVPRIRGAILDSLRALDWVPRSVRTKARSVQTAITQLEHTMGRAPNDEEIAEELQITVEELQKWLADVAVGTVGPLDHLVADRAPSGVGQQIGPADTAMEENALRAHMREEIKNLPERERTVLVLYYDENLTLVEIGEILGVTESRVSQIHSKAVLQLRSRLAAAEF